MSPEENEVLDLLGKAFVKFSLLPVLHGSDVTEMQLAIHGAQNIVLSREGLRANGIFRPDAQTALPGLSSMRNSLAAMTPDEQDTWFETHFEAALQAHYRESIKNGA